MLTGLGFLVIGADRLITLVVRDKFVDVDIALPGREPPGVTSPDLEPKREKIIYISEDSQDSTQCAFDSKF